MASSYDLSSKNPSIHAPLLLRPQRSLLIIMTVVVASAGLFFGYDTAVISGTLLLLRASFALQPALQELTVSTTLFGAMFGALLGGRTGDLFGRRAVLMAAAVLSICIALSTALAPNLLFFLLCRGLQGMCIGTVACILPAYLSEMAPPALRGMTVTLYQLAITVGIASSYWATLLFIHLELGWRPLFAISALFSAGLLTSLHFSYETPRWLASRKRWSEACAVYECLTGLPFEQALDDLYRKFQSPLTLTSRPWKHHGLRLALFVGVALAVFQQFSGINALIYYAPSIFQMAGFSSTLNAMLATGLIGVVNILATCVASLVIDRVGRRPLLLSGLLGMTLALTALGIIFSLHLNQAQPLILMALFIYIMAFALGMGPIFWLITAEIFPTRIRATGSSITTFANWGANLLVSISFLSLLKLLGLPGTFWLYALFNIAALIFCWLLLPETSQKTLEQIERYWLQGRRWEHQTPKR